jgi:hypothetical protein
MTRLHAKRPLLVELRVINGPFEGGCRLQSGGGAWLACNTSFVYCVLDLFGLLPVFLWFFIFCESSLFREKNHSTLQWGMLHTAAERETATEGDRGGFVFVYAPDLYLPPSASALEAQG